MYEKKYLKYKQKYIDLQNQMGGGKQMGGSIDLTKPEQEFVNWIKQNKAGIYKITKEFSGSNVKISETDEDIEKIIQRGRR